MGLTQAQKAILAKARSVGAGQQGITLSNDACSYLIAVIAKDLGELDRFPEITAEPSPFFGTQPLSSLVLPGMDVMECFGRLIAANPDADSYFQCLATLHKARLKYERILQAQPVPTVEQVGPRALLQHGLLGPNALAGLLLWRKWIYDVDNRAAQETGYVFEPIVAAAIGGVAVGSSRSPIRRRGDPTKGRQVDCVRPDMKAYEIKIRVTIAASGQGRWGEELAFPSDCKASGYTPVLAVLDPTRSPKLDELERRFLGEGGEVYVGEAAWQHFRSLAGASMGRFLDIYVHEPIHSLLTGAPQVAEVLPSIRLTMRGDQLTIELDGERCLIRRNPRPGESSGGESLPADVDEPTPGP